VDPTLSHPSPQDGKSLQLHALSCTGAFEIRGPNSAVLKPGASGAAGGFWTERCECGCVVKERGMEDGGVQEDIGISWA